MLLSYGIAFFLYKFKSLQGKLVILFLLNFLASLVFSITHDGLVNVIDGMKIKNDYLCGQNSI